MSLPDAITTCTINVGPLTDFAGDPHVLKVEWQAVLDGKPYAGNVRSITWSATGQSLASFVEKRETPNGGTVALEVPHVDQAGFIDGTGSAVTGWTYRVKVTARAADRKTYTKTKFIAPIAGQNSIDFDLAVDGTVVVPVSTPAAAVTSVLGQTGAITDLYNKAAADARTTELGDARYQRTGIATIIDLGNSIASQGTLSYYDRISSGLISFSSISYMGWGVAKTAGKFRCKGVAAIGGYTMESIIAELLEPAIAADPDFMHLMVFTNNMNLLIAGTQTLAQAKALYMQIVDAVVDAGIVPIIATVPPMNTATTGAPLTHITKVNLWLKRLAGANGWPLADYHSALVNPADNTLTAAYTVDGIHMTSLGARVMGDVLAATLNQFPTNARSPLWGSYNPNLMQPDCCFTSAGSDKWYGSGNTGGSWAYKSVAGPNWKGNSQIITRGSAGDYALFAPITPALWVAGHRVRVSFQFDATLVPAGGTWGVSLYSQSAFQVVCGYAAMDAPLTLKSVTVTGCSTTSGSKLVTGAPAGTFKPEHVGCGISSVGTVGLISAFPANTLVTNVSADGTTAYASANATDTRAGLSVVTISGPQCVAVFEFVVPDDMAGDTIIGYVNVIGQAGTTLNASQVTVQDLTAIGAAA